MTLYLSSEHVIPGCLRAAVDFLYTTWVKNVCKVRILMWATYRVDNVRGFAGDGQPHGVEGGLERRPIAAHGHVLPPLAEDLRPTALCKTTLC